MKPSLTGEAVQLDHSSEWIAADGIGSGAVYLFEGSPDPTAEFNKFAQDVNLRVPDVDAALSIFNLFLRLTQRQEYRRHVLNDEMQLESVALEDFRLRFPAAKRRMVFNHWWDGVSTNIKNLLKPPVGISVKDHFEVQYFFYWEAQVHSQRLTINADGTVALGPSKILVENK